MYTLIHDNQVVDQNESYDDLLLINFYDKAEFEQVDEATFLPTAANEDVDKDKTKIVYYEKGN